MWKPWELISRSNDGAVVNARVAATELSRLRVERADIELYVARRVAEQGLVANRPA